MSIVDFTPISLIDFPGKLAATAFTSGCNLRCRFCHNPELVLTTVKRNINDEFFRYIAENKINAVTITGGEPLINPHIKNVLTQLKDMNIMVKLDTNGSLPNRLLTLLDNNLINFIGLDLKGLNTRDIQYITRNKNYTLPIFLKTLRILKEHREVTDKLDNINFEIRMTLWKPYTKDDFLGFFQQLEKSNIYLRKDEHIVIQKMYLTDKILDKRFKSNSEALIASSIDYINKLYKELKSIENIKVRQ
ncbi:MAG: anaerobic ribonucleoside-triphosphate reductase activating protein [Deferribacterota bacterium]|nr:anaerobic ribonucleoside-triphosphate reductase activating protein [Deferribacterota bacterium]